jgi:hypothetical protein
LPSIIRNEFKHSLSTKVAAEGTLLWYNDSRCRMQRCKSKLRKDVISGE